MEHNTNFSDRISGIQASTIREIFKLTQGGDVISLAGGLPAPELFPVSDIKRICNSILDEEPTMALQYGITEGYSKLREALTKRMKEKYNIGREYDEIMIVSGGQQGAELTAKVLLNEGDGVICENPSFIGVLNCFRSYNANLLGVDVASDGMDIEQVEALLADKTNKVKLIYTIPTFQNPTGITMSQEKRKALLALAQKYDVYILEDNPYGELRFAGADVPTIKSMDKDGRVIYVSSFSKILSPGLRVAWIIANSAIMDRLVVAKQASDVHTNIFAQMIAYRYITECDLDGKIEEMRALYGEKCELMLSTMDQYFPKSVEYTRPSGGLFIWSNLPKGYDTKEIVKDCIKCGVVFVPGFTFMVDDSSASNSFRLNFSTVSKENIEKGIKILAEVFNDVIK